MTIFDSSHLRASTQHDDGYIDGWSQIKVHTDERIQVTALGLPWRSPTQVQTKIHVV